MLFDKDKLTILDENERVLNKENIEELLKNVDLGALPELPNIKNLKLNKVNLKEDE